MQSPHRRRVRRTSSTAKAVSECNPVRALEERARVLTALDEQLRQTLPSPLREQVRLADLRDGRIVFLAPTSAWASRLRMAQNDLLAAARRLGTQADAVVVKVVAKMPAPEEVVAPVAKPLPRAAANHLRKAAQSLSDHELRSLFLDLASIADDYSSPQGSE